MAFERDKEMNALSACLEFNTRSTLAESKLLSDSVEAAHDGNKHISSQT